MQLKTEAFQSETDKGVTQGPGDAPIKDPADAPDAPLKDPAETPAAPQPCPNPQTNPWTSKPPPLVSGGGPLSTSTVHQGHLQPVVTSASTTQNQAAQA